jgi:hypothetical protein
MKLRRIEIIKQPILVYLWLYSPLLDLGRFLSFLILYTVNRPPWTGDQPVTRPLPTQNKRTQTSISWVGFKPTIPVFEREKIVYALDRVVAMIDRYCSECQNMKSSYLIRVCRQNAKQQTYEMFKMHKPHGWRNWGKKTYEETSGKMRLEQNNMWPDLLSASWWWRLWRRALKFNILNTFTTKISEPSSITELLLLQQKCRTRCHCLFIGPQVI